MSFFSTVQGTARRKTCSGSSRLDCSFVDSPVFQGTYIHVLHTGFYLVGMNPLGKLSILLSFTIFYLHRYSSFSMGTHQRKQFNSSRNNCITGPDFYMLSYSGQEIKQTNKQKKEGWGKRGRKRPNFKSSQFTQQYESKQNIIINWNSNIFHVKLFFTSYLKT